MKCNKCEEAGLQKSCHETINGRIMVIKDSEISKAMTMNTSIEECIHNKIVLMNKLIKLKYNTAMAYESIGAELEAKELWDEIEYINKTLKVFIDDPVSLATDAGYSGA